MFSFGGVYCVFLLNTQKHTRDESFFLHNVWCDSNTLAHKSPARLLCLVK